MSNSEKKISRSYPLSTLFLLITACAAMIAMIALLVRPGKDVDETGVGNAITASVLWAIVFLFVGGFVGCFEARRLRGILWGAMVGLVLGLFVGPVLLIPSSDLPSVLLTAMIGAAMLLAVSATIRLTANYDRADSHDTKQPTGADTARPHPLDPDPEE